MLPCISLARGLCFTGAVILTCGTLILVWPYYHDGSTQRQSQSNNVTAYNYVTCGSVMKLLNEKYNMRLHSHEVKYGTGSGQQSVTAVPNTDDHNSYWQVKARNGVYCERGAPIKCNQQIRLMHLSTRRNLHSHHFSSPLSGTQEVSAFGEDGIGDEGDNWVVVCSDTHWQRDERVRFRHVATEGYLYVSGQTYGRPIAGQREVAATSQPTADTSYWKSMEGIFVKPSSSTDSGAAEDESEHDEL